MNQFSTPSSTGPSKPAPRRLPSLRPMLVMILAGAPAAWASTTDISTSPLVTLSTTQAKPNLLFVMDSSGSMNWSYMPDDLGKSRSIYNEPYDGGAELFSSGNRPNWYGYRSAQCNGLAFDPTADYSPPKKADGTSYPDVAYTAAPVDGYAYYGDHTQPTTDLSTSTDSYYYQYSNYSGHPAAMSWTYSSSGVVANTFYAECSTPVTSPDPSTFSKVTLSSQSAAIQQKYANWYSYYSRRYLLMRTAMGRAISTLDNQYRVGFSTIYDKTAVDGSNNFVDVKDFDTAQKTKFYNSLYAVVPSGGTNLPDALSEAGRYFAHKVSGQSADPMQYACQRNYTLLSTDGYWNTNSADFGLDGSTRVGEQDGTEVPPMKDSSTSTSTSTATTFTAPATGDAVAVQSRDTSWLHWTSVTSAVAGANDSGKTTTSKCTRTGYWLVKGQAQSATETQTITSDQSSVGHSSYVETVVRDASGTITSDTNSAATATWDSTSTAVSYTDNGAAVSDTSLHKPANSAFSSATSTTVCIALSAAPTAGSDTSSTGAWSPAAPSYPAPTVTLTGSYAAVTDPPPVVSTISSGGSSDTLADVAEYYWKTDLRTSALGNCTGTSLDAAGTTSDVCNNIVKAITKVDTATWQHMNTFTIGLGTSGTLLFDQNYLTQTSGTYVDLKAGTANWPNASSSGNALNIDDLWHAAVDGRGRYYSALNATLLASAISDVVNTVSQSTGSGAAAATSSLQLVSGDNNLVYQANYTTASWTGDLLAYGLSGDDLSVDATPQWSAQDLLDKAVAGRTTSPRTIYYNNGAATPSLTALTWSNLTTAQKTYFTNVCPTSPATAGVTPKATLLTQCSALTGSNLTAINDGTKLLDYLSGVRTYESASGSVTAPLFRQRDHVLGDIIDGAPVYVGKPPFRYVDSGYADFVTAQATRKPVVYVAANDGMLHAFSAAGSDGGSELWAFVPTAMLPNLYLLADTGYASRHRYFVDGAPVMGDIKVGSTWKTIVVGGFNDGGKGYYALDITNPASPVLLWEFTDPNLGLSYGNPVITKRNDGTWVVVFGSGYNNADGLGHLFVVNAATGVKALDIATPAGTVNPAGPTNPSGLAKINAWIESDTNNTATRFYGGDLLGNLWRFDVDNKVLPYQSSMLLAQFLIGGSTPQPITTVPQPIAVPLTSGSRAVVLVGTGRYLGTTDITDKTQQSIYAVADDLLTTGWGDVRSGPNKTAFVKQTLTIDAGGTTASDSNTAVDLTNTAIAGWYVDLPNTGERIAANMSLQFNTLVVGSAIPTGDVCDSGGKSWRYFLDATTGGAVSTNPVGTLWDSNALMVAEGWVVDANGNAHILEVGSNGTIRTERPPATPATPNGAGHRTSWRELAN
jgi:type IV pilus assembly protein PilY1